MLLDARPLNPYDPSILEQPKMIAYRSLSDTKECGQLLLSHEFLRKKSMDLLSYGIRHHKDDLGIADHNDSFFLRHSDSPPLE